MSLEITCANLGSLRSAKKRAGRARVRNRCETFISKRIRPGFTAQYQKSMFPFPRPLRTSFGFAVCAALG